MSNPSEAAARRLLCDLGRRLYEARLVAGRAGNLSLRLDAEHALVTPRGVHKGRMGPDDPVRVSLTRPDPDALARATTEWPMHREALLAASRVGAVLHTHAPALTALGLRRLDLADHLPEVHEAVGPLARVAFAASGSDALGRAVGAAVAGGATVVILEGHGVTVVGATGEKALDRLELAELSARAVLLAGAGREAGAAPRRPVPGGLAAARTRPSQ